MILLWAGGVIGGGGGGGEVAVDPPVVAGEAAAVQLLQAHQRHVVGHQAGRVGSARRPQEDAVEAAAADVVHVLVGVGAGVPRVAAVLPAPQALPHVAHGRGQAHRRHLEVAQVGVAGEQHADIVGRLAHPSRHLTQLCHALARMRLAAFQVRRHQPHLSAPQCHLTTRKSPQFGESLF